MPYQEDFLWAGARSQERRSGGGAGLQRFERKEKDGRSSTGLNLGLIFGVSLRVFRQSDAARGWIGWKWGDVGPASTNRPLLPLPLTLYCHFLFFRRLSEIL